MTFERHILGAPTLALVSEVGTSRAIFAHKLYVNGQERLISHITAPYTRSD